MLGLLLHQGRANVFGGALLDDLGNPVVLAPGDALRLKLAQDGNTFLELWSGGPTLAGSTLTVTSPGTAATGTAPAVAGSWLAVVLPGDLAAARPGACDLEVVAVRAGAPDLPETVDQGACQLLPSLAGPVTR